MPSEGREATPAEVDSEAAPGQDAVDRAGQEQGPRSGDSASSWSQDVKELRDALAAEAVARVRLVEARRYRVKLREELAGRSRALDEMANELKSSRAREAEHARQLERLEARNAQARSELLAAQQQALEAKTARAQELRQVREQTAGEALAITAGLKTERENLTRLRKQAEREFAETRRARQHLKAKLAEAQLALEEANQKAGRELAEARTGLEQQRAKGAELEQRLGELEQRLGEREQRLGEREGALRERETELDGARKELAEGSAKIEQLTSALEASERKLAETSERAEGAPAQVHERHLAGLESERKRAVEATRRLAEARSQAQRALTGSRSATTPKLKPRSRAGPKRKRGRLGGP